MIQAQNYSAASIKADGVDVVRLADSKAHTEVSIVPSIGNTAYEMKVNGSSVLWSPYTSPAEFRARPAFLGNPFMSPWANRLDQDAFWANGHKYLLNPELKNFRRDANNHPIHGLVSITSAWKIVSLGGDDHSAWVTSRLEFWRRPEWMAHFPFPHTIEMTYRLKDGVLEVHTVFENHASEPMPLVIGYHPFFAMPGVPRDEWSIHLPASEHVQLSSTLIPTGERTAVKQTDMALKGTQLDDVYTGLIRGDDHMARFSVEGGGKSVLVTFGPRYTVAVVYAPKGRDFVCFEPMTGITNGANLAHEGKYGELQSIPAGGKWEESFWVSARGF